MALPSAQTTDIVIIGAGAAGAAAAWRLIQNGLKVTCLEQGDWVKPTQYRTDQSNWELSHWAEFSENSNIRELPADYPLNNDDCPIDPLMYNAVGGSTIHWAALFPRMHPSDFKIKTLDGVGADFPFSYNDLEPYYDINDHIMGVSGLDGDPFYPPKSPRMPPLGIGIHGETIVKGFEKLGWMWWPSDAAIATVPYQGRKPCNYGNSCELGCSTGAKSSTDITYWPLAIKMGVNLQTGARVRELLVNSDNEVESVAYYQNGELKHIKAKLFLLACNGIGTARLLLNSASSKFPDGLANTSGLVGKNLMLHPSSWVTGLFSEDLETSHGPLSNCVYSHEFYETDTNRGFLRGCQFQIVRDSGPLKQVLGNYEMHRDNLNQWVPWGINHHKKFNEIFNRTISVGILADDIANEMNTVTLDPTLTDSDGIPAPKINYTISENTNKILDYGTAKGVELLEASGAGKIMVVRTPRATGWHLLGTARSGNDPATSVVNPWGRCHDVPNLFIADGSVMPAGGAVNPTSTIQAIALRTADHIKDTT